MLAHLLAAKAREELAVGRDRARAFAREAIDVAPQSSDALLAYAQVEGACGETAQALDAIGRAFDQNPRSALMAWPAVAGSGDLEAALRFVGTRLETKHAEDAALYFLQGRLLRLSGRRLDSLAPLRRALDLDRGGEVTLAMRDLLREAEAPGPEELAARHDLLMAALLRKVRPLRCRRCGAETLTRAWRCRHCGLFEPFA